MKMLKINYTKEIRAMALYNTILSQITAFIPRHMNSNIMLTSTTMGRSSVHTNAGVTSWRWWSANYPTEGACVILPRIWRYYRNVYIISVWSPLQNQQGTWQGWTNNNRHLCMRTCNSNFSVNANRLLHATPFLTKASSTCLTQQQSICVSLFSPAQPSCQEKVP